jgi:hypothetical protein
MATQDAQTPTGDLPRFRSIIDWWIYRIFVGFPFFFFFSELLQYWGARSYVLFGVLGSVASQVAYDVGNLLSERIPMLRPPRTDELGPLSASRLGRLTCSVLLIAALIWVERDMSAGPTPLFPNRALAMTFYTSLTAFWLYVLGGFGTQFEYPCVHTIKQD